MFYVFFFFIFFQQRNFSFFTRFDNDWRIITDADFWIENRSRCTSTNPKDTRLITLNKSTWIRIIRKIVSTKNATWILNWNHSNQLKFIIDVISFLEFKKNLISIRFYSNIELASAFFCNIQLSVANLNKCRWNFRFQNISSVSSPVFSALSCTKKKWVSRRSFDIFVSRWPFGYFYVEFCHRFYRKIFNWIRCSIWFENEKEKDIHKKSSLIETFDWFIKSKKEVSIWLFS